MIRFYFRFLFVVPILVACKTYDVCVTGKAEELKAGAAIITDDGKVYYLKDKYDWEEEKNGKQVTVKGKLEIINMLPDSLKFIQGVQNKRIIKKYKYR